MTSGSNVKLLLLILRLYLTFKMQSLKLHVISLGKLKGHAESLQGSSNLHLILPQRGVTSGGWPSLAVRWCCPWGDQRLLTEQKSEDWRAPPFVSSPNLHNLALRIFKSWVWDCTHFCSTLIFPYPYTLPHPFVQVNILVYSHPFSTFIQNTCAHRWRGYA